MKLGALGVSTFLAACIACGNGESTGEDSGGGALDPNFVIERVERKWFTDKVDLLLVVDNSSGMEDKQKILEAAVPYLVDRLLAPHCTNEFGVPVPTEGACPAGTSEQPSGFESLHVGVISSSLGGHGASSVCTSPMTITSSEVSHTNDQAQLLPTVRRELNLSVDDPAGFLSWQQGEATSPLRDAFSSHVASAGEDGCEYPAPLEAWYRFLVDPFPPTDFWLDSNNDAIHVDLNEQLLEQRDAFLRRDSLVVIVMLSDKNDCSVGEGRSWVALSPTFEFLPASEACDADPNDACCYNCQITPPEGCMASARCASAEPISREDDPLSLRCFDQKRRFGIDLLHPIQRYVDGVRRRSVETWYGGHDINPLMVGDSYPRPLPHVLLAGVVGVPWQDIATDASLTGPELEFLNADELLEKARWDVILGEPGASPPVLPSDPLMIESIDPRTGQNPMTGDALGRYDETPHGNPIHGHEYNTAAPDPERGARSDLQYACIFPVDPADCATEEGPSAACPCSADSERNDPICRQGPGEEPGSVRHFARAYPATRTLEVIRELGDSGIVTSICPKHPVDPENLESPYAGYNPAMRAIAARARQRLTEPCLARSVPVSEEGMTTCAVIQIHRNLDGPSCAELGARKELSPQLLRAVHEHMITLGLCTEPSCDEMWTGCEIERLEGDAHRSCLEDVNPTTPGVCYVDPGMGIGQAGLVSHCPAGRARGLRFVSTEDVMLPGGDHLFLACGTP